MNAFAAAAAKLGATKKPAAKQNGGKCDLKTLGKKNGLTKPAYLVLWSRFGTVTKYKWGKSDWTIR